MSAVCECVCVRLIVYACKKKTMGDCVYLLCTYVLWGQLCGFPRMGPIVDASARDLV